MRMKKQHYSKILGDILYNEENISKMRKSIRPFIHRNFLINSLFFTVAILGIATFIMTPLKSRLYILILSSGLLIYCSPSLFYLSFRYLKIYENGLMIPMYTGHLGRIFNKIFKKDNHVIEFQQIQAIYLNSKAPKWFCPRTEIFLILKDCREIIIPKDYIQSVKRFAEVLHGKVPIITNKFWIYKKGEFLPPPRSLSIHESGFELYYGNETISIKWNNVEKMNFKSYPVIMLKNGINIKIISFHKSFNKHTKISKLLNNKYRSKRIKGH